jgi:hypothetical protein
VTAADAIKVFDSVLEVKRADYRTNLKHSVLNLDAIFRAFDDVRNGYAAALQAHEILTDEPDHSDPRLHHK